MARTKRPPHNYTPEFKLEVLERSDADSPKVAAEHFDLPVQTIHQWRFLRKRGELKLPTKGEAVAELAVREPAPRRATHDHNGLPAGFKARVVRLINLGKPMKMLVERFPTLDRDTLKQWRKDARLKVKRNGNGNGKHLPVLRAEPEVEVLSTRTNGAPPRFQASAETMFARIEALEFFLAFLKH